MTKKLSNRYGKIMILIGALLMMPVLVVIFDKSQIKYIYSFILPGIISIILGFLIMKDFKEIEKTSIFSTNLKNSTMLVLFSWFYCFFIGSLPFGWRPVKSHSISFESVSGYTTTDFRSNTFPNSYHLFGTSYFYAILWRLWNCTDVYYGYKRSHCCQLIYC